MVFISGVKNTLCRNKIRAIYFWPNCVNFCLKWFIYFYRGRECHLLNVLCTFNLHPVSRGTGLISCPKTFNFFVFWGDECPLFPKPFLPPSSCAYVSISFNFLQASFFSLPLWIIQIIQVMQITQTTLDFYQHLY